MINTIRLQGLMKQYEPNKWKQRRKISIIFLSAVDLYSSKLEIIAVCQNIDSLPTKTLRSCQYKIKEEF